MASAFMLCRELGKNSTMVATIVVKIPYYVKLSENYGATQGVCITRSRQEKAAAGC